MSNYSTDYGQKNLHCLLYVTLWRKDNFSWTISVKPFKNFPNGFFFFFDASLITINISYQNFFLIQWCTVGDYYWLNPCDSMYYFCSDF